MSTDSTTVATPLGAASDSSIAQSNASRGGGARRADILDNVPLGIEVVLGRTTKLFGELREMQVGNPIALDRTPHQPVDVLVNGSLFARGEIVVINDENLGVRITEILQSGAD